MTSVRLCVAFASLLALGTTLGLGNAAPTPHTSNTPALEANSPVALEVRLRKMHLVRPDLISYPIYQDFYA